MLKIAHRGAKGYEPENTMVAFQKAVLMGADGIELDILPSKDGELMVFHDETLERMTDGKGNLIDYSATQLKQFRIEEKYEIPTLSEVLDEIKQSCFLNIELKSTQTTEKMISLLEEKINQNIISFDSIIISSFHWDVLEKINQQQPKIKLGVLTQTNLEETITFAEKINATAIHPYFKLLTAKKTEFIQQKGFSVFPWTVNETEDILKIKSFNINGIISDFIDRL